ncbi:DUF4139 domain-containing protein [Nitratifractor sp.]
MKSSMIFMMLSGLVAAGTVIPPQKADLSLTIYGNDRAFVHERREAKIPAGRQKLIYQNVPRSLIAASVVPEFGGVPVTLYSQNYVYDLISLPSMLNKSIGRTVAFYTNGRNPTRLEGTLLAAEPSVMVREKVSGKIYALEKATQVLFPKIPPTMITRPSLVWNIDAAKAGKLQIDLKYLSQGLSWKSDYVLNLHPQRKKLDLTGWITVKNDSGVRYPNARITCLAGEVHLAREENEESFGATRMLKAMPTPSVKEESFAGYHIYKIPFRETIADKEQKQIRFLYRDNVTYERYGKAVIASFPREGETKLRFVNTLRFADTKKNDLGIPLPAGMIRMYSADSNGSTHFIGESRIGNIPADENVTLKIGLLFDVTGEIRVVKYVARKGYRNVISRYTLHNRGDEVLSLKLEEQIPTYGGTIHLRSTCAAPVCTSRKLTAFIREFTVHLAPRQSYSFDSEFEVIR